jgi:hypothetical protein
MGMPSEEPLDIDIDFSIPEVKSANLFGRLICLNSSFFPINTYMESPEIYASCFWQRIIIFHIRHLFSNRRIDNIDFISCSNIYDASKKISLGSLIIFYHG